MLPLVLLLDIKTEIRNRKLNAHQKAFIKRVIWSYVTESLGIPQFELEMVKVHEAHEALVRSSERREQLERLARHKLHAEVKRLTDINGELREQVRLCYWIVESFKYC